MTYAEGTTVSVEKSKFELDTLLKKHGASQRAFADDDTNARAVVVFTLKDRQYRLEVPLPKRAEFAKRPGSWRTLALAEQEKRWHQATRERWRAVLLLVKAKLEIVALGISSVEKEFLADLVLTDGRRVHDALREPIASMYATGQMPRMLGMGESS